MLPDEFLQRLLHIRTHKHGGRRVPNKPLWLLVALGRIARRQRRLVSYARAESLMRLLLRTYGPPRTVTHPEFPFDRLRNDGVWDVPEHATLKRSSSGNPYAKELRERAIRGGFTSEVKALLDSDPVLVVRAVHLLLAEHFPFSLHEEIRKATKIPPDWILLGGPASSDAGVNRESFPDQPSVREGKPPGPSDWGVRRHEAERAFRERVLLAYRRRCAVCDFDLRLGDGVFGVEAAHIRWHCHQGPDEVANGLALCLLHHRALHLGALGLAHRGRNFRLVVSDALQGRGPSMRLLTDFAGKAVRLPSDPAFAPDPHHVAWHRSEVFRDPARDPDAAVALAPARLS